MQQTDIDIENLMRGRLAGNALAVIEYVLNDMERRVHKRILGNMDQGVAPEVAQQAWYEIKAIDDLRRKLGQLAEGGKSAAKRLTPLMENTHGA